MGALSPCFSVDVLIWVLKIPAKWGCLIGGEKKQKKLDLDWNQSLGLSSFEEFFSLFLSYFQSFLFSFFFFSAALGLGQRDSTTRRPSFRITLRKLRTDLTLGREREEENGGDEFAIFSSPLEPNYQILANFSTSILRRNNS